MSAPPPYNQPYPQQQGYYPPNSYPQQNYGYPQPGGAYPAPGGYPQAGYPGQPQVV